MENECEALPGVAYPGVRDNRSTLNTKTGHDDMMMMMFGSFMEPLQIHLHISDVIFIKIRSTAFMCEVAKK